MLRWLIAILFLANLLAFALASGMLGALPSSGAREPNHLNRQVNPESLRVRPVSAADSVDQAMLGGPVPMAAAPTAPAVQ
jgi:hypothetical protein